MASSPECTRKPSLIPRTAGLGKSVVGVKKMPLNAEKSVAVPAKSAPTTKVEFSPGRCFPLVAVVQKKLQHEIEKQKKPTSGGKPGRSSPSEKVKNGAKKQDADGIDAEALEQTTLLGPKSLCYICTSEREEPVFIPTLAQVDEGDVTGGDKFLFMMNVSDLQKVDNWLVNRALSSVVYRTSSI